MTASSPRRAFVLVASTLALVYAATLAPGVTLWDAGEFASAVESLGIPHPPGTPLFVMLARAWRLGLAFLPTAVATNLLAAVCTAVAGGIAAGLVARWTRDTLAAVAAGIAFGGMSSVWLNATETEVYAASLLLALVMIWVAARAGSRDAKWHERERGIADREQTPYTGAPSIPRSSWNDSHVRFPVPGSRLPARRLRRSDLLLIYLFAIAPPLHLSAMVAAPAAIALATTDRELALDVRRATLLLGVSLLAVGAGTGSAGVAAAALVVLVAWTLLRSDRPRGARLAATAVGVVALGTSAFLYLLLRSRLDPAINQGNPTTFAGVVEVIARRQYDVPGLWPRRAPFWLQVGNLFQYVDWQFALGLDRWVGASWVRTPFTIAFLALGAVGSAWHRRRDRRSWVGLLILVASATFGVVVYLNLKAGPSFGYGVLPPEADHEARERDYFFALGFAAFALWSGMGAVHLARRAARERRRPGLAWGGVAVAALPIALNWRAVDRRSEPTASLPNAFARATLESAPRRAVLFVAGDNDTYPLWYAQIAGHVRPDVSIVTVPLLPAEWYRAELARRLRLYERADTAKWRGTRRELESVAEHALRQGRPVAVAVALEPELRGALGDRWDFSGLIYTRLGDTVVRGPPFINARGVDSTAWLIDRLFVGRPSAEALDDPAARYLATLLTCPMLAKRAALGSAADSAALLASLCNFR